MLILSGCSGTEAAENALSKVTGNDHIQDDLLNYINEQLIPLQTEESTLVQQFNTQLDDPSIGDTELHDTLTEIIPVYKDLIGRIEVIRPDTTEVRDLHEMYIATANKQYNAMVQLQAAINNQDMNLVSEANEKLEEARRGDRAFNNALNDLSEAHNIVDIPSEENQ